ncbi:MAG: prolipoprotein diacylglyceryl transferase [Chloroflexota bacterium]
MIKIGISPVAFKIGPLTIGWYGIMIDLAIVSLVWWVMREIKRGARLNQDTVITAAVVGIPSGLFVSRLLHIIDQWGYYRMNLGELIGSEGLTIWGAVLGATLGIWVYSKLSHLDFGYFLDVTAPGILLAQSIGRVGCTLNGCCYGVATRLPWGIAYTNPASFGYTDSILLASGAGLHPVQVYEIIYDLIIFALLLKLRGRFKPDGSLFLIYLSFYALWRLFIDFIRPGTSFLFGLHQAQVISIVVLFIAMTKLILRTRRVEA